MVLEFADPEGFILGEIADKHFKRKDVSKTYHLLIKHDNSRNFDWAKINQAICSRWSKSGLIWIKTNAWNGRCWL